MPQLYLLDPPSRADLQTAYDKASETFNKAAAANVAAYDASQQVGPAHDQAFDFYIQTCAKLDEAAAKFLKADIDIRDDDARPKGFKP